MTNILMKLALRGASNENEKRQRIGYMTSIVGIVVNMILATMKIIVGVLMSSISVIADGFDNTTDIISSIVALIAFKIAHKPPDRNHPYGHGRAEYIGGLVIAFIVIFVGLQFTISSFKEILNPTPVKFQMGLFIILVISIFAKIWLAFFNIHVSKKTNSQSIRAMGLDAFGDVLTTGVVVVSLFIGRFTSIPIDGYVGVIVSFIILYGGYTIVKETVSTIIGEGPDREWMDSIKLDILEYKYITGVHDLCIHTYGANKAMAVIDVEFPAKFDILKVHKEVTKIEREIGEKYNMDLVVHMDPLGEESEARYEIRKEIQNLLREYPIYKSIHDFKDMKIDGVDIIEFHMVIYADKLKNLESSNDVEEKFEKKLKSKYPKKEFNIVVDMYYD